MLGLRIAEIVSLLKVFAVHLGKSPGICESLFRARFTLDFYTDYLMVTVSMVLDALPSNSTERGPDVYE